MTSSIVGRVALRYMVRHKYPAASTKPVLVIGNALGRIVYAEFVAHKVEGVGENSKVLSARDTASLTVTKRTDADAFGAKAYRLLASRFGDPGLADEAVQRFLQRVLERGIPLQPNTPLRQAQTYVIRSLINVGVDLVRMQRTTQQGRVDFDSAELEDVAALAHIERLPASELVDMLRSMERIHPRARLYLDLVLNGHRPAEIAETWGVSQPYLAKWVRRYGPQIQTVVRRYVKARLQRAAAYSFDRRHSHPPNLFL